MTGWPGAFQLYRSCVSQLFHFFHFPHRFSKNPTVFHSGRQSEGFSKVGTGVGGIVCMSGLPGRWVLGRMALWCILLPLPSRRFLLYGSLLHPSPFFISAAVLSFLTFSRVSSFLQEGSLPSQVTLEQILQRRAIPTNILTMSLWSVTSLLILRGQSSIMWRMIPCLRAVGTQVGT